MSQNGVKTGSKWQIFEISFFCQKTSQTAQSLAWGRLFQPRIWFSKYFHNTLFRCTLCAPTTYHFLIEIISSQNFTRPQFRQVRRVALYFCDISRLAYDLLIFPNRVMAIACLFLSFISCGLKFRINSRDNPIIYMNVKTEELIECISALAEVHQKSLSSRFEDNTNSSCTVRGKTNSSTTTHPYPNAFKNLYVNKRWATTLSTFQKDYRVVL